ncbi:MAG TPA: glycosyltransferase family 4 protein [Steroidobacteraceae bacterium]|nr:glycosyltransferase family 4 protein [Steroidobacteraceae bacterium]
MRVLHLLSSTGYHGAETMAAELVRHTISFGVESHIGIFDNGGRGNRQILDATRDFARGTVIPCAGQYDGAAVRAITEYVRAHDIDVVHSHKYKTTFHALLARRKRSFPLLATYHNWLEDSFLLKVYAFIDKRLARFVDANVGVSTVVAAELARWAPAQRVHYIGNGIDTARFAPAASAEDKAAARARIGLQDGPVIGFVGRLTPQKGVEVLIAAFHALDDPRAQLLIVGDGESRAALEATARAGRNAARITFLGTRSDTPELFRAMDVFALPSFVEAFPMVLLEAMASEVPVIGTPVGDVPKIVTVGTTGQIVPLGDAAKLSSTLAAMLADEPARLAMGKAAREDVVANHSAQAFARNYVNLYEKIIAAKRG